LESEDDGVYGECLGSAYLNGGEPLEGGSYVGLTFDWLTNEFLKLAVMNMNEEIAQVDIHEFGLVFKFKTVKETLQ